MRQLLAAMSLLAGLGICSGVWADPINDITTADAVAIHTVVESQFEALSKDDANGAFELTTPAKRMLIGTPDNFMRIIKEQYNPIYRHLSVIFSRPEVVDGDAIQVVRVTDRVSHVWIAIFWMEQLEDSSWKIDGCQLLETSSVSI